MNKLLIAALLVVFSTSVLAEWTDVGSSDNSTGYADFSTIRKSGNKVKIWNLIDFKVVQTTDGKRYLSTTAQNEYDCKEETWRNLAFIWYSKNMEQGEVVYSSGTVHEEPRPMPPNSGAKVFSSSVCGK